MDWVWKKGIESCFSSMVFRVWWNLWRR